MRLREDWLDARLGAIAARVEPGARLVADIGADHGRLACALLLARPELRMIVADISADSLAKSRRLLEARGLSARADFRVADGLCAVETGEHPDAVVLAGMGGETIRAILEAPGGAEAVGEALLILQPNLEASLLRGWLCEHGYRLCEETVVRAARRFYVILCARRGAAQELTPKQRALGPILLEMRPPDYAGYLRWRTGVLRRTLAELHNARERDATREAAIAQEISWNEEEYECE